LVFNISEAYRNFFIDQTLLKACANSGFFGIFSQPEQLFGRKLWRFNCLTVYQRNSEAELHERNSTQAFTAAPTATAAATADALPAAAVPEAEPTPPTAV